MINSAAVFDFNGTLFWDSEYQESSWIKYLTLHNIQLTADEINIYIHGRNAKDTFEYLFKKEFTQEQVNELVEQKEVLYRKECLRHEMKLAPGATELLQYLKDNNVPTAIATASGKTNVEFFIKHFSLLDYFDYENIIYDDGNINGKPYPDLFLKAMQRLSAEPEYVTIFEDSVSGIEAAKRSKAKNIVWINSKNPDEDKRIIYINDFRSFDKTLFL